MRSPGMLSVLLLCLSGCSTQPVSSQAPAAQMVDEHISQSSSAISLAQARLHATTAGQQITSLPSAPSSVTQPAQLSGSGALISSPRSPAISKDFNNRAESTPAKVVIVEIPPVPPKPILTVKAATKAPQPIVPPVVKPVEAPWVVSPADVTVRRVLVKWVARAGWQLVWDASVDVPVTVSASINGDFKSAVKRLFLSLSAADVNLSVLMYSGNKVLRVTESGRRAQ